jgi:hypothetical protein
VLIALGTTAAAGPPPARRWTTCCHRCGHRSGTDRWRQLLRGLLLRAVIILCLVRGTDTRSHCHHHVLLFVLLALVLASILAAVQDARG